VIEESTKRGLDYGALRDALEGKDPDLLLGFYSEEAELRIVNAALPEGVAFELKGRAQIERYLRAVCEQEMLCLVGGGAVYGEEGSVSFSSTCEYPDGSRISVRTTLKIVGSLIVGQTDVVERAPSDDAMVGGERRGL
jgi:hypothetical protein